MSMKRENFVEIKEDEDDRRRYEQKWSADDDIREESCNGSGPLFERMAQQTRPRMMTNDESNDINSNNVEGSKFKQIIYERGDFPYTLYHLLMKAESMKYFDIVPFLRKERYSNTHNHESFLRSWPDLLQASLVCLLHN